MSAPRDKSGLYLPALAVVVLVAICAVAFVSRSGSAGPATATGAAMLGYRNPDTGEFGVPPADVTADLAGRAIQRAPRMVERPGTTPGGGVLLDGAPMMGMTATVDSNGQVSARCGSEP